MTDYEKYRVVDAPIAVPSNLGRYGLSEVINHLLELTAHVPFDFMIANNLIRTSLKKHIARNRISTEEVIVVHYMPVTSFSDESKQIECPAWVGAVTSSLPIAVIGCYDGQLRLSHLNDLSPLGAIQAHKLPIRSLAAWEYTNSLGIVATASKDQSVRCWYLKSDGAISCVGKLESTLSSVESVAYWKDMNAVIAGDWAGNVFAYDMSSIGDTINQIGENGDSSSAKRKKKKVTATRSEDTSSQMDADLATAGASVIEHLFTMHAHSQAISAMKFGSEANRLYTASWDHSVKEWDLERQESVATFAGSKVISGLDFSPATNVIVTSHTDGRVRLWDSRSRDGSVCINTFVNGEEKRWVSDVKWHPTNTHIFCTTDYDGNVRAWDTRAALPLSTTAAHDGKALCVAWTASTADSPASALSGGSDCCLRSTTLLESGASNDEEED